MTLSKQIRKIVGDHIFDSTAWDTGVRRCRHDDHRAGYTPRCEKAWLREQFPDLFPSATLVPEASQGTGPDK